MATYASWNDDVISSSVENRTPNNRVWQLLPKVGYYLYHQVENRTPNNRVWQLFPNITVCRDVLLKTEPPITGYGNIHLRIKFIRISELKTEPPITGYGNMCSVYHNTNNYWVENRTPNNRVWQLLL